MLTFMLLLISHKLLEVFKHTERENKYFLQFFFVCFFLKHLPFLMLSSLIGLSLLTWHCPSRHWTSSHGSHLPNHHIHPLQKCQADKVSNFMPALTFKIFFLFLPVRHVEHALCCGTSFVYPVICQAPNLEQHTERTHPKLLPLEAVSEKKGENVGHSIFK